jgi:hypothetical protein
MTGSDVTATPAGGFGLLRRVLWADAWGSGALMLVLIVGAGAVGRFAGIPFGVPLGIGLGVIVPWVTLVALVARRFSPPVRGATAIIAGNLGGVAAVVVVLIEFPDALLSRAEWVLAFIGVGMLVLAVLEWIGLRRAIT